MPKIHNRKDLKSFRKELRHNLTSAEATLWKHLQRSQLGKKFRRQHNVGNYIIDFYCATQRLAVELDGEAHFTEEGLLYDKQRTKYLNRLNIHVLRFENEKVFTRIDEVLNEIKNNLTV